jgi:hypothetical protein
MTMIVCIGRPYDGMMVQQSCLRQVADATDLPPASVDALSGYRLIRNLREVNLTLAQAVDVIGSPRSRTNFTDSSLNSRVTVRLPI